MGDSFESLMSDSVGESLGIFLLSKSLNLGRWLDVLLRDMSWKSSGGSFLEVEKNLCEIKTEKN
jgi:hypothetical protein